VPPADDEQLYPLAKTSKRPGRSVRARDYTLPKPYRKKTFVEDRPPPMSPLRLAMLVSSGLLVVGLIGVLIMLVKENRNAPHLLVIAAPVVKTPPAATMHGPAPAAPALPPTLPDPPPPSRQLAPGATVVPSHAPRASPGATPVPLDPDVDLIAAILTLTMHPVPAQQPPADCLEEDPAAIGCTGTRGMKP
jgi:hypothetical protein